MYFLYNFIGKAQTDLGIYSILTETMATDLI